MKRLAFLAMAACLAGCVLSGTGTAGPITYTETFTATGSLSGTSFTNATVTLTFTGDTANVTSPSSGIFFNETGTATVNVAGITATFASPAGVFASQGGTPEAGFAQSSDIIEATRNSTFATYDLGSAIGPVSGTAFIPASQSFITDHGLLFIGTVGTDSTFQATTTTAVPEPASLTLLGIGAAGLLGWRRRRGA